MTEQFYKIQRKREHYRTCWDIYPKILKKIKFSPYARMLDAGCGIGELSNHLKILNLYGFDNNKWAVNIARKKNKYAGVKVGDITKIPYKDYPFDKTFCIEVLEYVRPVRAFKELLRVTDGEVIVGSANFNWYWLKSRFSKKWWEQYVGQLKRSSVMTNKAFFEDLAEAFDCKVKIFYVSNRFNWLRSLFGNYLASEVVGVFTRK